MQVLEGSTVDGVQFRECQVSRHDVGDEWPFTVPWVRLRCYSFVWLTVEADGQEFALNGLALGCGFPSAKRIWAKGPGAFPRAGLAPLFRIAGELLAHRTDLTAAQIAALQPPTPSE